MSIVPHSTSRVIIATSKAIFRAHLDPEVLAKWRAPAGMEVRFADFMAKRGGGYRMELRYPAESGRGKSTANSDIIRVRFVELVPDELIVEAAAFESEDPDYAGVVTITTRLSRVADGTKVSITAENVPPGISEADPRKGLETSLKSLALLLE
ncbi:MAG: SRPBCC domain-containing protein [Sphingopyxis sp.]|nr:SRPBCC domain-containing protein [Sphingopyxis sp.]